MVNGQWAVTRQDASIEAMWPADRQYTLHEMRHTLMLPDLMLHALMLHVLMLHFLMLHALMLYALMLHALMLHALMLHALMPLILQNKEVYATLYLQRACVASGFCYVLR